jgi:hypothetical protein
MLVIPINLVGLTETADHLLDIGFTVTRTEDAAFSRVSAAYEKG